MQNINCAKTKTYLDSDTSLFINRPSFQYDSDWQRPTYEGQVIRDIEQNYVNG